MHLRSVLILSSALVAAAAFADGPDRVPQRAHGIPQISTDPFTPPQMPLEPDDECATIEARERDWLRRHGGDPSRIDPVTMRRATQQLYEKSVVERRGAIAPLGIAGTVWSSIGPTNIGGRVVSIAPHPTVAGTVYVGSATGGVWKTTDFGATWTPLTESLGNLSVGAIAVAPSSPNTIYLGTGEPVGSGIPGIGFLSSSNGGSTWNFPGTGVLSSRFWKLSVQPANASDILAATANGGFRSTNGGMNWTPWVVPAGTNSQITDIVRDPSNASTLYATTYGYNAPKVLKSTDGGSNWSDFSSGLTTDTSTRRMMLAIDGTGTVLYLAFEQGGVAKVYKSTGGGSWAGTAPVNSSFLYYGQGSYNNAIAVAPGGSSSVIVCGGECSKSTTGGSSWAPVYPSPGYHVDIHDLRFDAGGTLYIGTDGGIYTTTDLGATVTNRENGMVTAQFYGIANDPVNVTRVFGGMQDNGSARRDGTGTDWTFMVSSDGGQCVVDRDDPSIVWLTNQVYYGGNHLWRTKDAGNATSPLFEVLSPTFQSSDQFAFPTILAGDPILSSVLYTTTDRLWRSTTGGDTWTPLPTTTTDGSTWNADVINAIAIARSDRSVLMVGKGPKIFRSTDGGSTWVNASSGLPGWWVNDVAIDPRNSSVAWAAIGSSSMASVYSTSDGGQTWTLHNSGLPNFAADTIRFDPSDSNTIYCGTDVGVYRSIDGGSTWSLFGTGMPKVAVYDLRISDDGTVLRAGTFGRGVWELQIPASANHPPTSAITSPASQTVTKGTTLTFSGTVDDPDGDTVTTNWIFPDTWERGQKTGRGVFSVPHTFSRAGIFPVTLAVRDEHGAASAATVVITVTESGDTCASAIVLPNSGTFPATVVTDSESWTGYDWTDPSASCTSQTPYYSGWFVFTAPSAGTYKFSTCGSTFNTIMAAYTGSCGSLSSINGGCNDDIDPWGTGGCPQGGSQISVSLGASQTIYLMVYAKWYSSGQGLLSLTVSPSASTAPAVTRLASNAGSSLGGNAVTLYGSNFVSGAGVTFGGYAASAVAVASPYIINAVTPAHAAGTVDVVVTNPDATAGRLVNGFVYSSCSVSLSAYSATIGTAGANGLVKVVATPGCAWTAVSSARWLTTTSAGIGASPLEYTVAPNTLVTSRSATITLGDKTFNVTQSGVLPYNFSVTATSTTSVSAAWLSALADHFEIWRNDGSGYTLAGTSTACSFSESGLAPNTTYVYKVRAIDGTSGASAFTAPDLATTRAFTDDPLVPTVTLIRAVHIAELRQAVNAFRVAFGLGLFTFSDDPVDRLPVRLVHLTELRTALDGARTAAGLLPISWTAVTTGSVVNAAHFTELRNGLK